MNSKEKTDIINVLIAGTAGQGVITLKRLIEFAAQRDGAEIIFGSEMHGLAQREGAITSHTRYQMKSHDNVRLNLHSPSICFGDADVCIAIEPVEALRQGVFASEKTKFVVNSRDIPPILISADMDTYPSLEEIKKYLMGFNHGKEGNVFIENFTDISLQHFKSNQKTNIIMLGAASGLGFLPFIDLTIYELVIKTELHEPEENIKALRLGYELGLEWKNNR